MKVSVYIDRTGKSKDMDVKDIPEIIKKLKLVEEEYIIVKNGELVTVDAKLKKNDEIKFLSVISGG